MWISLVDDRACYLVACGGARQPGGAVRSSALDRLAIGLYWDRLNWRVGVTRGHLALLVCVFFPTARRRSDLPTNGPL